MRIRQTMRRAFRVQKNAAPLKPGTSIDVGKCYLSPFRVQKNAAPLKPFSSKGSRVQEITLPRSKERGPVEARARPRRTLVSPALRDAVSPLIAKWEAILDVQITGWGIKKMKTKWGACSVAARRIWLNLELAKRPMPCLEYLIVHELIHLIEPHHNERFISLLDQHLLNWRMHRQELNAAPLAHNTRSY